MIARSHIGPRFVPAAAASVNAMKIIALCTVLGLAFGGCLVDTGPHRTTTVVRERSCGPAYHWEGGACVHNGRALGHDKHDRDHGHGR